VGGMSYMYLVKLTTQYSYPESPTLYKIGYTNEIKKRMSTLKCSEGKYIEMIALGKCKDYKKKELQIHKKLAEYCNGGDYFVFPEKKDVNVAINIIDMFCDIVFVYIGELPKWGKQHEANQS
jgi:hypothetical protein